MSRERMSSPSDPFLRGLGGVSVVDMSPEDALEVLGLAAPVDAPAVRAAYLARLRVTKPDQKPLEFRRLREAYERLQHGYAEPHGSGAEPDEPNAADAMGSPDEAALDDDDDDREERRTDSDDDDEGWIWSTDDFLRDLEREVPPGLLRLRALDDAIDRQPTEPKLYVRFFEELLDLGLEDPAGGVLEALSKLEPVIAWQLAVRKLPRSTTTCKLRNPPPGVTVDDRLAALEILVDVHRHTREVEPLAVRLALELDPATLATLRPRLIKLGLKVAATGFVTEGQSIVRAAIPSGASEPGDAFAEWARLEGLERVLTAALAAALCYQDHSFISDVLSQLGDPARERALLSAQSPELMRRYGALLPERLPMLPTESPGYTHTLDPRPSSRDPLWPAAMSMFGIVAMVLFRTCASS